MLYMRLLCGDSNLSKLHAMLSGPRGACHLEVRAEPRDCRFCETVRAQCGSHVLPQSIYHEKSCDQRPSIKAIGAVGRT